MRVAAYCRVSTDKEDQLNSLAMQKEFFIEYVKSKGNELVEIYADEGISGTKIKNRTQFKRMLADAEKGLFDIIVVKDVSRLARNTVDFLESIHRLKNIGVEVQFVSYGMTTLDDNEFTLTVIAAMAQEESKNLSVRVKFGKHQNAVKGRVPNIIYGYDKTKGDYFNLKINEAEAEVVRRIFKYYTEDGMGAFKIAEILNGESLRTKRNYAWRQEAVCRLLTNPIYTGKITNGRERVENFLTGKREDIPEDEWLIVERPDLRIIDDEVFERAQEILRGRYDAFKLGKERHSNKYLFSTIIKCAECGWSFRRTARTYKNTYVRWVCSCRNGHGADKCPNATVVDEEVLIQYLQEYFSEIVKDKKKFQEKFIKEFQEIYKAKDENVAYEKELNEKLSRLVKTRKKYMDMYEDDLISREELNEKIGGMRKEIERIQDELKLLSYQITKGDLLQKALDDTFRSIEDVLDIRQMTNAQLKRIVKRIEVDKEGNVDIFFRTTGDIGLEDELVLESPETILFCHDSTQGCNKKERFWWIIK